MNFLNEASPVKVRNAMHKKILLVLIMLLFTVLSLNAHASETNTLNMATLPKFAVDVDPLASHYLPIRDRLAKKFAVEVEWKPILKEWNATKGRESEFRGTGVYQIGRSLSIYGKLRGVADFLKAFGEEDGVKIEEINIIPTVSQEIISISPKDLAFEGYIRLRLQFRRDKENSK